MTTTLGALAEIAANLMETPIDPADTRAVAARAARVNAAATVELAKAQRLAALVAIMNMDDSSRAAIVTPQQIGVIRAEIDDLTIGTES